MQVNIRRLIGLLSVILALSGISQAVVAKVTAKSIKPHANITMKQAEAIALHQFAGKIVQKTKLEKESKVWEYSVMVKSGKTTHEVMVNAKTGKIDNAEANDSTGKRDKSKSDSGKEKEVPDNRRK